MSTNVKAKVHIRWMIMRDYESVIEISNQAMPVPFDQETLKTSLRRNSAIGMVAEHEDNIVAFMIYIFEKKRIHLEEICVHEDYRRQGIGHQLIARLIAKLSERREKITLHCRESNLGAQRFYRSENFHATAVLRNYYYNNDEDAYCFEYDPGKSWESK
jgi:[ribosomal protein S18]-alanine N-acetyltransferase